MTELSNPTAVVIKFLPNWETIQHGQIHAGGKLVIEYDMKRMPDIGQRFRDAIDGDIEVYVKFHPGEVMYIGKVLKKIWSGGPGGGPVVGLEPVPYELTVPTIALQVELWFRGLTRTSLSWDSRYGQNYWFFVKDESRHDEQKP